MGGWAEGWRGDKEPGSEGVGEERRQGEEGRKVEGTDLLLASFRTCAQLQVLLQHAFSILYVVALAYLV